MRMKTFCCKRVLVKNNLKVYSFILILFSLFYFFTYTMRVFVEVERYEGKVLREDFLLSNVGLGYLSALEAIMLLVMPVLLALILFKYIQSSSHVTMIHSMPFTRRELFNSHYLSGNILFMFPIAINQLFVLLILIFFESLSKENLIAIVYTLLSNLLFFNLVFSLTIAIGMMVGNLIVQLVLSYIFLFLPKILSVLLNGLLAIQLKGFPKGIMDENFTSYVSPYLLIVKIAEMSQGFTVFNQDEARSFFLYHVIAIVGTIAAFVLAKIFYKYRQLERNKDYISYDFVRVIFVLGMSYCGMALSGIYVYEIFEETSALYFGTIVGSFVSYFVAQMIAEKTVFVISKWKGFLVWTGVTLALLILIQLDFFGYENRSMNQDDIKAIHFKESYSSSYLWSDDTEFSDEEYDPKNYFGYATRDLYTSEEALDLLTKMQKITVEKQHEVIAYDEAPYSYYIELISGEKSFTRKYEVNYLYVEEVLNELRASDEYVYNHNPILWEKRPDFHSVYVESYQKGTVKKVEKVEISALIDAIHEDLLRIAKEDQETEVEEVYSLRFEYLGDSYDVNRNGNKEIRNIYIEITSRYETTLRYLEKIN
ncbi:MAG: hypothetical protein JW708_04400 [Vallitaleaceae bacterium]|nr:hypothetical protein [Vallitaleaceae bacterium]